MQLLATHWYPDMCQRRIAKSAKQLTNYQSCILFCQPACRVGSPVLNHPNLLLYDRRNTPLFLPRFWVRPKYNELLYAASRVAPEPKSAKNRPGSGLVKILCAKRKNGIAPPNATAGNASVRDWIGASCQAATLFVWFPAHGAPAVCQSIKAKTAKHCEEHPMWFEEQAQPSSRSATKNRL